MSRVEVHRLVKTYGRLAAVNDVSFDVPSGQLFFLLGPSGCGKTTILRAIAGFVAPDSGSIRVGDRDVTRHPPHRRNVAMVFQNYALWPHMTAFENVRYGLDVRKLPRRDRKQQANEALRLVRMERHAHKRPAQLSGGQQQRIALARALAVKPSVLLLDEPLSNLDAKLRQEMRDELRRIHAATGVTAIYVTHDQKEALSMAERVALMNEGSIVQTGSPADLYRRPRSAFVARFLGQANFLPGRVGGAAADGRVSVDTSLGKVVAGGPPPEGAGARVLVCIRPESLRFASGAPVDNVIAAQVTAVTYLGEMQEYTLKSEHQPPVALRAAQANPGADSPAVGDGVRLHFAPEDAILLPAEKDAPTASPR